MNDIVLGAALALVFGGIAVACLRGLKSDSRQPSARRRNAYREPHARPLPDEVTRQQRWANNVAWLRRHPGRP